MLFLLCSLLGQEFVWVLYTERIVARFVAQFVAQYSQELETVRDNQW